MGRTFFVTIAWVCALIGVAPGAARATPFRAGTTVFRLGDGREATRDVRYVPRAGVRIRWSVVGFTPPEGQEVMAYGGGLGGRLVAAVEPSGVMYTDDGRTWHVSSFEGGTVLDPVAIAVSPVLGALVTETGGMWVTRDSGESWQFGRERSGRPFDDVAVVGSQIVFSDDQGGAWLVDSATSAFRTLCDTGSASAVAIAQGPDGGLTARGDRCAWRVDRDGATAAR